MDLSFAALIWSCLIVVALAIRCETDQSGYLTVCQLVWICLLQPPLLGVLGSICFGIGVLLSEYVQILKIFAVVSVIVLGSIAFLMAAFYIAERSKHCHIIWRRKE